MTNGENFKNGANMSIRMASPKQQIKATEYTNVEYGSLTGSNQF